MFWSSSENKTKISYIYILVYPLIAKIVHFYSELMKAISYYCKLINFKSVLHEFPVYSVKSRQIT